MERGVEDASSPPAPSVSAKLVIAYIDKHQNKTGIRQFTQALFADTRGRSSKPRRRAVIRFWRKTSTVIQSGCSSQILPKVQAAVSFTCTEGSCIISMITESAWVTRGCKIELLGPSRMDPKSKMSHSL